MLDFTQLTSVFDKEASTVSIIVSAVVVLLCLIAQWNVFEKAGEAGWKAIIPIYNMVILCRIADGSALNCLLLLIPVVNVIYYILLCFRLARAFGKGVIFGLGLLFFTPVFYLILGFGESRYRAPQ